MPQAPINEEIERIARDGVAPVHVQPILMADGSLYGVEALLRADSHAPIDVLELAERKGLLMEVEFAVLTSCVRIASTRPDLGMVHLNVSWRTLSDPGMVTHLNALVAASGIDPERISIELSEREVITDRAKAAVALRDLKQVGVCFAIDDFGVGYNQLSTIKSIPINCLKLDQSIVHATTRGQTVEEQERAKRLVLGTKLLAKSLGASFVLEGIESPEEKSLMVDLDCAGQGFFLGRPVPVEELVLPGKLRSVA